MCVERVCAWVCGAGVCLGVCNRGAVNPLDHFLLRQIPPSDAGMLGASRCPGWRFRRCQIDDRVQKCK